MQVSNNQNISSLIKVLLSSAPTIKIGLNTILPLNITRVNNETTTVLIKGQEVNIPTNKLPNRAGDLFIKIVQLIPLTIEVITKESLTSIIAKRISESPNLIDDKTKTVLKEAVDVIRGEDKQILQTIYVEIGNKKGLIVEDEEKNQKGFLEIKDSELVGIIEFEYLGKLAIKISKGNINIGSNSDILLFLKNQGPKEWHLTKR